MNDLLTRIGSTGQAERHHVATLEFLYMDRGYVQKIPRVEGGMHTAPTVRDDPMPRYTKARIS